MNGIHQPVRHTKKGDNAPDTQQCTNVQTTLIFACMDTFTHVTKHHSNTRSCRLRCMSYPEFPNSVAAEHSPTQPPTHHQTRWTTHNCGSWLQLQPNKKLLRKEVIHPHLPVRVPCYDFVPIADPTFDGSLTRLGHRLRVLPTFMT